MNSIIRSGIRLFYPETCAMCSRVLVEGEDFFCLTCERAMPLTRFELWNGTALDKTFFGRIPLCETFAWCGYSDGGGVDEVLRSMKYRGRRDLCRALGVRIGESLVNRWPSDLQILPVPIHRRKRRIRGYNQTEEMAQGLSHSTGWPIITQVLQKSRHTQSQTGLDRALRWNNVQSVYFAGPDRPDFRRPIVLLDDVVTTGATIVACFAALNPPQSASLYLASAAFSRA